MVLFTCWLGARRPRNLSDAARGLPRSAWPTVIHAPWSQGQMEACRAGCACGVVRCIRLCIPGYSATRCVVPVPSAPAEGRARHARPGFL